MRSANEIAINYAKNRHDLRAIETAIGVLLAGPDGKHDPIRLAEIRGEEIREGENLEWYGWEALADNAAGYPPTDEDIRRIELGKLLDRKKRINADAGNIKRALYQVGESLLIVEYASKGEQK